MIIKTKDLLGNVSQIKQLTDSINVSSIFITCPVRNRTLVGVPQFNYEYDDFISKIFIRTERFNDLNMTLEALLKIP
jgi:hypothetical protein